MSEQRRKLRFQTLDEILDDAISVTSDSFYTVGTWSSGQIFEHLARTMDVMLDGTDMKVPFFMRTAGNVFKGLFVRIPMRPGLKLPNWARKQLIPPETTLADGLAHLHRSCQRLRDAEQVLPHPIFGKMNKAQAVMLHCRHAELHLSHIVPRTDAAEQS